MKLSELFRSVEILEKNAENDLEITHVTSDSRKVHPHGSVFVCLRGTKFDGHEWIGEALKNGAEAVVCLDKQPAAIPHIRVADTRKALPLLLSALYDEPQKSFKRVIGITGTNGKTTTSFFLKRIFEEAGCKTGLIGTTKYLVGNEEYPVDPSAALLTTPDPELLYELLNAMRAAGCDTLIMEASSHALYFKKLAGIHFHYGIFTNLTQDHIDFHKTMKDYMEAKKLLFSISDTGIFNADDAAFSEISSGVPARVVRYSAKGNEAEYRAENPVFDRPEGVSYTLSSEKGSGEIQVGIPGGFTVYNSLAAVSCALEAGIDPETVRRAVAGMQGVKGRIERIPLNKPYSVFIDFAHTPDALSNILKTLREFTRSRLICLFGCGGDRDRTKRPIMGKIAAEMSDFVIITSDNSRSEEKADIIRDILEGLRDTKTPYRVIEDRTEAIHFALTFAEEGDTVLLAGKGHEEYEIDKTGKHEYSERKIVASFAGAEK